MNRIIFYNSKKETNPNEQTLTKHNMFYKSYINDKNKINSTTGKAQIYTSIKNSDFQNLQSNDNQPLSESSKSIAIIK